MKDAGPVWSRVLSIGEVPDDGLHVDIIADATTRAALARTAGLRGLPRLEASFDLVRTGKDKLHVVGEISADLQQDCVVTLEPIEQTIFEPVELVFVPGSDPSQKHAVAEATVALNDSEPPEPLRDGTVDLGAIATEYLLLAIDPFPRKEGAVFEPPAIGGPESNPFAALAALKKRPPDGE